MSDISVILAALGNDQPNALLEAELMAMGRWQPSDGGIPVNALRFNDNTPLQFSDGSYLETAA